jgi:hypothetical protein
VQKNLRVWLLRIILCPMQLTKDGKIEVWISAVFVLVSTFLAPAQTPQRMVLPGTLPTVVPGLVPLGWLDGSTRLKLSINLPLHNQEALTNFLEQIYNPASPLYRHYLSPEEFDARFGPTEQDYQAVIAWATGSGFTVTARRPSRMLLEVSAAVTDIERALHVTMRTYTHPTEPRTFFAPDAEPSVDTALPILNIDGLDNFARPHPKNLRRAPLKTPARATPHDIGSGPNGNLAGFDYRAAYAPGVPLKGTGQMVGLLEFDGYYAGDITSYESLASVSNVPLQKVLLDEFNGDASTNNSEVALDIEMAISMAPGLSSVVVFEGGPDGVPNSVLETMSSSSYTNIKQFSCSWSFAPINASTRTAMDGYFMKFASQGQSFFVAAGDGGASTNGVATTPPDDDPYVTLVGGTTLGTAGPGAAWLSETVWNAEEGPGFAGSGGGVSTSYPIPPWQLGVNMTANGGSKTHRNSPDVAMVADNIFIVADNGELETTGGTSCSSPMWAAFTALANQQAVAAGLPTVGFLNPALYSIGTNSGFTACFDDVTFGNNTNSDSTEYFAVPGYDLCTGWGSPSGSSLIIALTQPDGFQITPGRGMVANGPVGGPFTVATQTFSLTNTGKTAFNWSLVTTSAWLNVSSTNGTLAGGGAASVSLTLNAAANLLPVGVYTAGVWFTNQTSGLGQFRQFSLQAGQELVLDGGFEAGDFCYWNLSGDSSIFTNNFVDDGYYLPYSAYAGNYYAALGQVSDLAYLSQPLPTRPGQLYLLSFWLQNPNGATPNRFQVQWNTNSSSSNIIFNQTDMGEFDYTNMQFTVEAATDSTTLSFGNRNDNDFFCLDSVSVMAVSVAAPSFQAPAVVNGLLQLAWTSVPGVSYQVQYATNLVQTNWINLLLTNATVNPTTISESIATNSQQFYRVVVAP